MSFLSDFDAPLGLKSRRVFLEGAGVAGFGMFAQTARGFAVSKVLRLSAQKIGKSITLLNDGRFQGFCWGWQFTSGASVVPNTFRRGHGALQIVASSGDYARFLVLGPEAGKTYTLSGWVKTDNIIPREPGAGAYFAATQFEFQGRPAEFTVDGKQRSERRFGNICGSQEWHRFSQSFTCLLTTTWFEIVLGVYRAEGTAWFSDLTFVEGDHPAELDDVLDVWQAAQLTHQNLIAGSSRLRPVAAIFSDTIPIRGAASDPLRIAEALKASHDCFARIRQIARCASE